MIRSLFAHFEAKEASKPPPPEAFGSATSQRELRWVTAGRVAVGVVLVGLAVLLFVGPDLDPSVVNVIAIALVVAVVGLLVRGAVALSRLAAAERDDPST